MVTGPLRFCESSGNVLGFVQIAAAALPLVTLTTTARFTVWTIEAFRAEQSTEAAGIGSVAEPGTFPADPPSFSKGERTVSTKTYLPTTTFCVSRQAKSPFYEVLLPITGPACGPSTHQPNHLPPPHH